MARFVPAQTGPVHVVVVSDTHANLPNTIEWLQDRAIPGSFSITVDGAAKTFTYRFSDIHAAMAFKLRWV
jgi:2',3'-cyclic-nucleotide 2'-phosphodiesterase (5'-nucleotidase family)